jgi:hypothetical protein
MKNRKNEGSKNLKKFFNHLRGQKKACAKKMTSLLNLAGNPLAELQADNNHHQDLC